MSLKKLALLPLLISCGAATSVATANDTIYPQVMTKAEIAGDIFKRPDLIEETSDSGRKTWDVISLLSRDKKFVSGMYRAEAGRFEITEPYGVDEYMHFLAGSVTLTSSDGKVTVIHAGDSVTIPKEWTGIWETEGYTKIYVIYSPDEPLE